MGLFGEIERHREKSCLAHCASKTRWIEQIHRAMVPAKDWQNRQTDRAANINNSWRAVAELCDLLSTERPPARAFLVLSEASHRR